MTAMVLGWKTAKAVTIWAAATALSIGVAWFGVRPVLDAAVPDRLLAVPGPGGGPPSVPPPPPSARPRRPRGRQLHRWPARVDARRLVARRRADRAGHRDPVALPTG